MRYTALTILLLASTALSAAESLVSSPAEAEQLLAYASARMEQRDSDDRAVVDAALAYHDALAFYREAGPPERVRTTQSCLFWTRKAMSSDQMDVMLAELGTRGERTRAVIEAALHDELTSDDADQLLAAAATIEDDQVTAEVLASYAEVAERLPGTPQAAEAEERIATLFAVADRREDAQEVPGNDRRIRLARVDDDAENGPERRLRTSTGRRPTT